MKLTKKKGIEIIEKLGLIVVILSIGLSVVNDLEAFQSIGEEITVIICAGIVFILGLIMHLFPEIFFNKKEK